MVMNTSVKKNGFTSLSSTWAQDANSKMCNFTSQDGDGTVRDAKLVCYFNASTIVRIDGK
jgi:hypothetical protein